MNGRFILKGHQPEPCEDLLEWGRWYEKADRHVAFTQVTEEIKVSTVFLGLDHSFSLGREPILFETMIFGGPHDQGQWRYSTWEEAEAGHARAVALSQTEGGDG